MPARAGDLERVARVLGFVKMNSISSGDSRFLAQALPWVAEELIPSR